MTDFTTWDRARLERLAAELAEKVLTLENELRQARKVAARETGMVDFASDLAATHQADAGRVAGERDWLKSCLWRAHFERLRRDDRGVHEAEAVADARGAVAVRAWRDARGVTP